MPYVNFWLYNASKSSEMGQIGWEQKSFEIQAQQLENAGTYVNLHP